MESGDAVVANRKTDKNLIAWAKKEGFYVYIGRPGKWGNPFVLGKHGDRDTVMKKYRDYLAGNGERLGELNELRGKVLGCFCYPEACHGDILIEHLGK
jgi:hypothetical protein